MAQLQSARDQLNKGKSAPTAGEQLTKILKGDDIEGVTPTERGGLALNEDFAFAKGSDELSAEGKSSIGKLAARLNSGEYAGSKVMVEGHTDDTPVARASTKEKFHDNWGLSGARAAAVIRALQSAGVDAKRIQGQFRGEYAPRGGDKAANRRVEIYLGN
jgi:chemotaxis protein MotB